MKKALIYIGSFSILVAIILASCEPLDIIRVTKINTGEAQEVTYSSITMQGMIIDASDDLVEVGHCWSENPSPDYFGNHAESVNGLNPGEWIYTEIKNLRTDQDYFIRAYANLGNDNIIYGDEIKIHTNAEPSEWGISVTNPSSEEYWPIGKQKTIAWTSNMPDTFVVELCDVELNVVYDEIARIASKGDDGMQTYTYDYVLSDNLGLNAGERYAVRVRSANYNGYDYRYFHATNPSISSITSPVAGDQWNRGREYLIDWTSQDIDNIDITLYSGSTAVNDIATEISNNNTFPWTIPNGINPGNDYRIVVSYHDYPEYADTSDVFEILSEAYINITEPNSSTQWANGTEQTIVWTDNISENVKIELIEVSTTNVTVITDNTASLGTYKYTPNGLAAGSYTLKISSVKEPNTISKISAAFQIN